MKNLIGYVEAININVEKGKPRKSILSGKFIAGKGLLGDAYFGSKVELVMLPLNVRQEIEKSKEDGLCFNRFVETIMVSFKDYRPKVNDIMTIGGVKMKIISLGKRCFPECKIIAVGNKCALAYGAIHLEILVSGTIEVNDTIYLVEE